MSTAPEKQGLGYAGSLVNQLAAMVRLHDIADILCSFASSVQADAQLRGIWLLTNLYTTGFYERFGFKVIESISLGDDNPTWKKGPVVLCIVGVHPRSTLQFLMRRDRCCESQSRIYEKPSYHDVKQ